jgi:translation initiation factor eIF-2B subunit epsilon
MAQNHCASSDRTPLFGQVLAALYQADIVDEDDIREWHASPASRGAELKSGPVAENAKKCRAVGTVLIQQFDEQEESEEESE